jgi:dihydroxy-acid dehydratase
VRSFGLLMVMQHRLRPPEDWRARSRWYISTWNIGFCQHFKQRVEDVKRGVLQAGRCPLELPALSLSESLVKTTMLYRKLLAMDVEELPRSHPIDGGADGRLRRTPAWCSKLSANAPSSCPPAPCCAATSRQDSGRFGHLEMGRSAAPARSTRRNGSSRRRHCAPRMTMEPPAP